MFEAMAAACAIVLAVDGEARATLERAGAGIAVEPGSAAALVNAITMLAGDAGARRTMGRAGSEFVSREFSRAAWARRYIDVLAAANGERTSDAGALAVQPHI
jgi:glycosyltransferase involved in cell wall biosynthesis